MMNPEIKARWVAALRSGEYKQTDGKLLDNGAFCCLGVLCDLHAKANMGRWKGETYCGGEDSDDAELPRDVQAWAGLQSAGGGYVEIEGRHTYLAAHNDGFEAPKRTFAEIADAIEAQL